MNEGMSDFKILTSKPTRKRPLGRFNGRQEKNIKIYV